MKLYLSILQGECPATAIPLIASDNQELVRAIAELMLNRLGAGRLQASRLVGLVPKQVPQARPEQRP